MKKLLKQQEDGEKAELFVKKYENFRLEKYGLEAKQISQIDVTAGYDILSYENLSSSNYDMFIEVKSYHGNPHFYWSDNERNTSKALRQNYYLYLVDIDKIDIEGYCPTIIVNPYDNLSPDSWLIEPQSFYIRQI